MQLALGRPIVPDRQLGGARTQLWPQHFCLRTKQLSEPSSESTQRNGALIRAIERPQRICAFAATAWSLALDALRLI